MKNLRFFRHIQIYSIEDDTNDNSILKNFIFKFNLTIFPHIVQSGTVSKMCPASPIASRLKDCLHHLNVFMCGSLNKVGETGPILDSRGFSRISPDPLRQKSFFWLRSFFSLASALLIFLKCVTLKFKNLH